MVTGRRLALLGRSSIANVADAIGEAEHKDPRIAHTGRQKFRKCERLEKCSPLCVDQNQAKIIGREVTLAFYVCNLSGSRA